MNVRPKISVIIPVYKVEQYISRCIDSILVQSFSDFELILIDDGSPDNSGKICDEYAAKDIRIKVFHKGNNGVSSARKYGVNKSIGEWVTFVDSDDWLYPNALQILLDCSYGVDLVNASLEDTNGRKWIHKRLGKLDSMEYLQSTLDSSTYGLVTGCLFKKEILTDDVLSIPDDIKIGEDILMKLKLWNRISLAFNTDKIVYCYFINNSSVMQTKKMSVSYLTRYFALRKEVLPNKLKNYCEKKELQQLLNSLYDKNIKYKKEYRTLFLDFYNKMNPRNITNIQPLDSIKIRLIKTSFAIYIIKVLMYRVTQIMKMILRHPSYIILD